MVPGSTRAGSGKDMKILLAIYGTTDGIEMLRAAQAFRSLGFDVSVHVVGQIDMILDRIGPAQAEGPIKST